MRSYRLRPGVPGPALEPGERRAPGPHEVRVRIRAVSLNYRDLLIRQRVAAGQVKGPLVPVSDGAGEIVETGPAVTRLGMGARVAANFFPAWLDGPLSDEVHAAALGGTIDGVLAEEVVLHEDALVELPAHLSYEEGATLPCAAVTAWHALFEATCVRPGETVLVQGTGGVSLFALQLAHAAGANVIVTSSSAEKRARAAALGAVATIDYAAQPEWGAEAHRLTGGRGVDAVVEVGGPGTFDQSVAALRYGGTMGLVGLLTGRTGPVNTAAIFNKAIRVAGIYVGTRRMFESLNRALTARRIRPVIDTVFDFGEAPRAYEHLESGRHFGKVVIRVA